MKSYTQPLLQQAQEEMNNGAKVYQWNQLLMSTLGLWPRNRNIVLFALNIGYFSYEMILEYLDLFLFIDNLEHVLMNLTENVAFTAIFVRMLMLKVYNDPLGEVIDEATKDFDEKRYNEEERKTFLAYHEKSKIYMKLLTINTFMTATSYYAKPLMIQAGELTKRENSTLIYILPYRFYTFYELNDDATYFWTYCSQLPFVFVSSFGQCATDCLMVTLVYHISGQMAVLALRVANIDISPGKCTGEIRKVVKTHMKLLRDNLTNWIFFSCLILTSIRMGKIVQEAFNTVLLVQLLESTSLLCIVGYQLLTALISGNTAILISFLIYLILVFIILYVFCAIGESLITESERLCAAFYTCNWYEISGKNKRFVILCTVRSQKPLQLTAGKFGTFCLATFMSIIKASMGYLSVLRAVMN